MADKHRGKLTAEQLCAITGLTHRRHQQLASAGYFRPPIDGMWQAGLTLVGFIKYQKELLTKKNGNVAKDEEALKKAKRELAEEELAKFRGEYIQKSIIVPALRNLSLHQRAVFQRKLEQELAPQLAGETPLEIL